MFNIFCNSIWWIKFSAPNNEKITHSILYSQRNVFLLKTEDVVSYMYYSLPHQGSHLSVRLCLCLSVGALPDEPFDVWTYILAEGCILTILIPRTSSKAKVIGLRSRSPGGTWWSECSPVMELLITYYLYNLLMCHVTVWRHYNVRTWCHGAMLHHVSSLSIWMDHCSTTQFDVTGSMHFL